MNALHTRDHVFFQELLDSQPLYRVADQVFVFDDAVEACIRLQEEGGLPEWLGRFVRSPGFRALEERAVRRLQQRSGLEGYGSEGLDG